MVVVQVSTIYRDGLLAQAAPGDAALGDASDMSVDSSATPAPVGGDEAGEQGQDEPPQILEQLLTGGVSPVEVARLAQSGRRIRLGAFS